MIIQAYTGFALTIDTHLVVNDVKIPPGALVITAALVKVIRSDGLADGSTIVTCTKPGGTLVRAHWTGTETAAITPGSYILEIRTNDGPYCHVGVPVILSLGVSPPA